jgi:hypothetical protein
MEYKNNKIAYLGMLPLFIMLMGLGVFIEYQKYATWSFILIYLCIFGLPFVWALPLRDLSTFNIEKAFVIGVGSVFLLAIYHLTHFIVDGDKGSFVLIIPLISFFTLLLSSSLCFKK